MRKKVLLLFPMADGQTGPAIKYALEKLGHEVKAVDAKLHPLTSYSVACDYRPELVFCSRTKELTEQVAHIKRKFPNAITCMWNVDTRNPINEWAHLFPLIKTVDYHFVVEYNLLSEWRKLNRNTSWLPQGLQNEVYDKPKEIKKEDRVKYACDVSFAGGRTGFHKYRVPYLKAIEEMGIDFRQWGCLGVPRIYNEEHNKMVALSKINFCCSGCPENERYTSVRNYKLMGAGGFVLELYRKGIDDIFPFKIPGLIGTYVSPNDLVERIRYWLNHEEERKAMAERGYKWVHENATYTHRIQMALDYMEI